MAGCRAVIVLAGGGRALRRRRGNRMVRGDDPYRDRPSLRVLLASGAGVADLDALPAVDGH
jgi:hypothetical protein